MVLPEDAIPALSTGANLTSLSLGPTEGFLLSRIDGSTTVRDICSMSSLSPEQTKEILLTLAQDGVLTLRNKDGSAIQIQVSSEDSQIDPNLRMRITQLLRGEETGNPYQVLFVDSEADLRTIKRSYYTLTQDLHPDNFYGLELGSWKDKLDQAFAAITKAYEDLSNPDERARIDGRLKAQSAAPAAGGGYQSAISAPKTDRKQSALFQAVKGKIQKARQFAEEAEKQIYHGDFMAAYSSYKLAQTYDPRNEEYNRNLEMLEGKVAKIRAANTFKRAQKLLDNHDEDAAIELLRQVVEEDKSNATARFELAKLLFPRMNRGGPDMKAEVVELAESAAILDGDKAEHVLLAAKVVQAVGDIERARELYKAALKLDRKNEVAKRALKEL